jgi:hypothetical protein
MNERLDAFRARIGGIAFGADYNPEQWDRATWDEGMALMRAAGVNLVTLGVFAWACLEPEPGTFTFGWLDEVMDLLHGNGISVDLATLTAAPPAWLSQGHPEVLPVTEDGHPFGSATGSTSIRRPASTAGTPPRSPGRWRSGTPGTRPWPCGTPATSSAPSRARRAGRGRAAGYGRAPRRPVGWTGCTTVAMTPCFRSP